MSIKSNGMLNLGDFELSDMSMLSGVDNKTLLAEIDKSVSTFMDIISMEDNLLLQNTAV